MLRLLACLACLAAIAVPAPVAAQPALVYDGCCILSPCTPWVDHVMHVFSAQAGTDPVNDIHVCVYSSDGTPLEIVAISTLGCWEGHFEPGDNCIEFWTEGDPIEAGALCGPFDFVVPPGSCNILVEWRFTYDGSPVTDWETVTWSCVYTSMDSRSWSSVKALYR